MVLETVISESTALLLLRLILAEIFILHGYKKLFKKDATKSPYFFLGIFDMAFGLLMFLGMWTDYAGIGIMIIMIGAIYFKTFVWKGQKFMDNIEFDMIILISSLVITILGPGNIVFNL